MEKLGHHVERVFVLPSEVHLLSYITQHRTSGNNALVHFAHHGQILGYLDDFDAAVAERRNIAKCFQ